MRDPLKRHSKQNQCKEILCVFNNHTVGNNTGSVILKHVHISTVDKYAKNITTNQTFLLKKIASNKLRKNSIILHLNENYHYKLITYLFLQRIKCFLARSDPSLAVLHPVAMSTPAPRLPSLNAISYLEPSKAPWTSANSRSGIENREDEPAAPC